MHLNRVGIDICHGRPVLSVKAVDEVDEVGDEIVCEGTMESVQLGDEVWPEPEVAITGSTVVDSKGMVSHIP